MARRAAPLRRASRSRAPRVRTRDPAEKRARVMDVARALFAERGYAATTTAEVARRAGVSEGILYHHFGSKEGLLAAVAGEYGRGLAAAMFEGAAQHEAALSVESTLARAFAYVREQGTWARLLVLAADPTTRQTAREASRAEIVDAIARALRNAAGSGQLRPLDPQIAAELLFALVEAALTECFVRGGGAREADYLRETVRCVEGAVRALGASPSAPQPSLARRSRS